MPLAAFAVEDSPTSEVVVEVDDADTGRLTRVARGDDGLLRAGRSFESALSMLKPVLDAITKTLREAAPEEAVVELGLKLSAEAGAILTKASGDAHITLKLTWKRAPAAAG